MFYAFSISNPNLIFQQAVSHRHWKANMSTMKKRPSSVPSFVAPSKRACLNLEVGSQTWYSSYSGGASDAYCQYMDVEWGVPIFGKQHDNALFELLCLEGAQAGLSWAVILKKREAYRRAFMDFDISCVACFSSEQVGDLLTSKDEGPSAIVKNRAKIQSVIKNARCSLEAVREFGSLSHFLWSFCWLAPTGKFLDQKGRNTTSH